MLSIRGPTTEAVSVALSSEQWWGLVGNRSRLHNIFSSEPDSGVHFMRLLDEHTGNWVRSVHLLASSCWALELRFTNISF